MASSVTRRFDKAYGVAGDVSRKCVRSANVIAARTAMYMMLAIVLGIDFIVPCRLFSSHFAW